MSKLPLIEVKCHIKLKATLSAKSFQVIFLENIPIFEKIIFYARHATPIFVYILYLFECNFKDYKEYKYKEYK